MSQPCFATGRAGRSPRAILLFVSLTLVLFAADLSLKYAAFEYVLDQPVTLVQSLPALEPEDRYVVLFDDPHHFFAKQPSVNLIPHVLDFHLTTNTGAVFGMAKGARWIFIGVSVVATMFVLLMFARSSAQSWLLHMALALILAGALGNLYDRLRYAAVRDMLHLFPDMGVWPWIFNLADAVLMIGVGLVLCLTFVHEQRRPASESTPG